MTDRFKFISFEVCKELFPDEMQWLHHNRYGVIEKYPDYLSLLSTGQFSHWHMCNVKQQMDNEAKEKTKKLEDEQKAKRSGVNLTDSHRSY
jgi:hypothetical protein